jgi:hypothetical protein
MLNQKIFDLLSNSLRDSFVSLDIGNVDEIINEAKLEYEKMASEMPYIEDPTHCMAEPTFICCSYLALFIPLRIRGVSAHTLGNIILNGVEYDSPAENTDHRFISDAEKSLTESKPNEFVFEFVPGDGTSKEWSMNVRSCALCIIYSKYSAMELLPYMCATDDEDSKARNMGLARSGTIALGAHECDFKYKQGGEPKPLAPQFPDKIKIVPIS